MKKALFTLSILCSQLLFSEDFQARAIVESNDRTILSSEIGGTILTIDKNSGDYFKKNEILVKIDCNIYKAEREKIRVKKELARVKLNKNLQLKKFNSVGQFDVETSRLELRQEELDYKIANINVDRCEIKAPFEGRVVQRVANKYQTVKPQEQLLEIVNSKSLEIKSVVPATWLRWLKINDEIVFKIDEINKEVKTKILQIDSVVDPKSQTINIRAKIEDSENIIAGMSGTVYFIKASQK